jgi:F-type H+-transporting ATPase subunit delta
MSGMAVVAKSYAKALFAVAREQNSIEKFESELAAIVQSFNHDNVISFLNHPNIAMKEKHKVVEIAIQGKVSPALLQTILLMVERGRIVAIQTVLQAYRKIADEALGRAHAHVTSAFPISSPQQQDIIASFSKLTGKSITIEAEVDSSLLGGIRVRIGDTMYDGSLATKLATLEKSFNKAR